MSGNITSRDIKKSQQSKASARRATSSRILHRIKMGRLVVLLWINPCCRTRQIQPLLALLGTKPPKRLDNILLAFMIRRAGVHAEGFGYRNLFDC